ncbi:serine protease [Corallococcus sp. H22C18031201]|uniref:S1 family peptidase n=1 Tax=Citreicoccus inhibens TaxID=2849499 RepID=UPI000E724975|nr:serine protease [Citreicoccus inhibens]MBU8895051.1 serine protease [Citreicoccus inhibens]RJS27202.1 serine protease [Corallococcus sp. H22C18031201]
MPEATSKTLAREVLLRASASVVLLEVDGHPATGFVASDSGHLITSLHAVAGARVIMASLPDGAREEVPRIIAVDERRDLAVLRLPTLLRAPALAMGQGPLPAEGEPLVILCATAGAPPEARTLEVRAVQVLGDWLTLLELTHTLPEESSGGPVLDARGEVVGVATAAVANGRALGLVIPARYASPLLQGEDSLPLSALETSRKRARRVRQVPHHPVGLLSGCPADAVEAVATTLGQTINMGAPAYNRGDVDGCYRLYCGTAEQLIDERRDCPGVQGALREGLRRCEGLTEADDRAWALRDTFDGLLDVIGRWLQHRTPPAPTAPAARRPPKTYLN